MSVHQRRVRSRRAAWAALACVASACSTAPDGQGNGELTPTVPPEVSYLPSTVAGPLPTTTAPSIATGTVASPSSTSTTPPPSSTLPPAPIAAPPIADAPEMSVDWSAVASRLGPVQLPTDCPLPLNEPGLLPNSDRSYRGGVHAGTDFVCLEVGHLAHLALPERVVMIVDSYREPDPKDREQLLDEAQALGETPPFTLQFLFGRFVVIDHGNIEGVGHVVSIYAHLAEVNPSLRPGEQIAAGALVGLIGNSGTETAATGGTRPQSIHLHWELDIDDRYFSEGLNEADTSAAIAMLFAAK